MARKWWTLIAVSLGVFMLLLDVTIVNVALPAIQQDFSASLSDLQWVIDAYALVLSALLLTAGSVADLIGRRRVFATGIVLFTLSSLLCGLANGWLFLALARGLQGVGGAIMFATSLALLAQAFRTSGRSTAFAVFGAVTGIAVAIGPVLGGALTSWLSWNWIFFVNLPLGLVALVVTLLRVEESKDERARRLDLPGFVTFSLALGCLVFALVRSEPEGWGSTVVLGSLTASGLLLAAFVLVESRSRAPMFDFGLLRVPTFVGGLVAAWAISASIFSLLTYLLIYLQNVLHYTPVQAGIRVLPLSVAVFFAAGAAGRLCEHLPVRVLIGAGFALIGTGLLLMRGIEPGQSWTHFIPGFVISGIGAGFINVPLASTAVGVVPARQAGMASGVNSTFRQVGIATGVAALGSIFSARITDSLTDLLAVGPLAARAQELALAATGGQVSQALTGLPPEQQAIAMAAVQQSFATSLNDILLIGAALAFVSAVFALVLIRSKDFVSEENADTDQRVALAVA
jgi:EmrB/QacA subfamily drug resistance transporter